MKKKDVEDFASTDEKGLPKKKQNEAKWRVMYDIIKSNDTILASAVVNAKDAKEAAKVVKSMYGGGKSKIKKVVKEAVVNNLKQAMSYIHTDTKDGAEFMKLMKLKSYNKKQAIRAFTLGMRGDAVHGAGPGGMSQFARHVTKHLKESVNEVLPKLKFGGQKDNPTRDKLRGELAKQHKAVVKLFDKSQGKVQRRFIDYGSKSKKNVRIFRR